MVLENAQSYATAFLGCTANLPPLYMERSTNPDVSGRIPYIDCAESVDNRLKPILDPYVGR